MGLPVHLSSYEAEWLILAERLYNDGTVTLPVGDRKRCTHLRLRFYGFRKVLAREQPANPYLGVLMETQVTVDTQNNLVFTRSPFAGLLRGLLEHSHVNSRPDPLLAELNLFPEKVDVKESDKVIEELYGAKEQGKK